MGGIGNIRIIPRIRRFPKEARIFIRYQDRPILRDRRRTPVLAGEDPLEARADQTVPGTLPERIVHKKLTQLGVNFLFQRTEGGGRNILGGYVLDFLIVDRVPFIALEVLGEYWHQAYQEQADLERELAVRRYGYDYAEIRESEIYTSDRYLEERLVDILGRVV